MQYTKDEGIYMVNGSHGAIATAHGTKFVTQDGVEIPSIISYSMKETGVDDVRTITLTCAYLGEWKETQ